MEFWLKFSASSSSSDTSKQPLLALHSMKDCLQVLFYCHYPDMLLATRVQGLRQAYRRPLDALEEWSTGRADLCLVNSRFTQGKHAPYLQHANVCLRGSLPQNPMSDCIKDQCCLHIAFSNPCHLASWVEANGALLDSWLWSAYVIQAIVSRSAYVLQAPSSDILSKCTQDEQDLTAWRR